jgi:hypothetical protein
MLYLTDARLEKKLVLCAASGPHATRARDGPKNCPHAMPELLPRRGRAYAGICSHMRR